MKFLFRLLVLIVALAILAVGGFRFLVQLEMFDEYRYVETGDTTRIYRGLMLDITQIDNTTDLDIYGNIQIGKVIVYNDANGKTKLGEISSHNGSTMILYNGAHVNFDQVTGIGRIPSELFASGVAAVSFSYAANGLSGSDISIYIMMALAVLIIIYGILLLTSTKEPKKVADTKVSEQPVAPVAVQEVITPAPAPAQEPVVIIKEVPVQTQEPVVIIKEVPVSVQPQVIYQEAAEVGPVVHEVIAPQPQVVTPDVVAVKPVVEKVVIPQPTSPIPIIPNKEYSFVDKLCLEYITDHQIAVDSEAFGEDVGTLTFDKIVKYCEAKDNAVVKIAVGRKPTSFRVEGKKSFMMLYCLDDKVRMVFKCGPIFGEELIKKSNGVISVSNFPHGSVWFATEDITLVDNKMLKKLIDSAYHLALHDI